MQAPATASSSGLFLRQPLSDWPHNESRLVVLLSILAGMVDVSTFLMLGAFSAHITGNLAVLAAASVRGGSLNLIQALAIPAFMSATAIIWTIANVSQKCGADLARLLLWVQALLLATVSIVAIFERPSASPHGFVAGIAVMLAVSAMACQYALLRLVFPDVLSTASMTGNLTNAVLAFMGLLSRAQPGVEIPAIRLWESLPMLIGFIVGCIIAAAAISLLKDVAWLLSFALATGIAVRPPR